MAEEKLKDTSVPTVTTVAGSDGVLVVKGVDGEEVRYVREKEATDKVGTEHQKVLQTEARIETLEEQLKSGEGNAAELVRMQTELTSLKKTHETISVKYLEQRRASLVKDYNIPKETVASKDLAALDVFEEALKAVGGNKRVGNFAAGVSGGGTNPLQGRNPMDLAVEAYSRPK